MNSIPDHKRAGFAWGSFIGDALAMPLHWYFEPLALLASAVVPRRASFAIFECPP
jgi:hypothetical protein